MEIDFEAITEYQRYKLMASLIVPRPIALVTTLSASGTINAAPFSSADRPTEHRCTTRH